MKLLDGKIAAGATVLGLVCTVAALRVSSTECFHRSVFEPGYPQSLSNHHCVTVWGWPSFAAVDHPLAGRRERLEPPGELVLPRLVTNFAFCTALLVFVRGLVLVTVRRTRMRQPIVAALLCPVSVFLVAQVSLPFVGEGDFIGDAPFALWAAVAAAPFLLLGVPLAWLLAHRGWFGPGSAAGLGAFVALLPFLETGGPSDVWALFVPATVAAAGAACALTFWAFSGLGAPIATAPEPNAVATAAADR